MSEPDAAWMARAVELAELGRCGASPNPMVGAVVLDRHGELVGEGYHARFGGPHAEVTALAHAGERAEGGTLVVTLEPCAHHGKTPPCVEAVLAAGISRVVVAVRDPHHKAAGGIERLESAGVEVTVGLDAANARRVNRRWLRWAERGRPWITLKAAVSLDGRIATRTGESQWITGEPARQRGLELREEHDAILVGVGTVLADDPRLTRRLGRNPSSRWLRVVLDSRLRTPPTARVVREHPAATLVVHTAAAPAAARTALAGTGVRLLELAADADGRVAVTPLVEALAREPVAALLVEGGGRVHGTFVDHDLVDETVLFVAPMLLGGTTAPAAVAGTGVAALADARRLSFEAAVRHGEDLELRAVVREEAACSPA